MLDVRSRAFTEDLAAVIKDLDARGYRPRVLFLEASDAALIRRYEANRRSHPLQGGGRLADGVAAERAVLEPLRQEADVVVDTSELSVHQLRAEVERAFAHTAPERRASLTVVSFGFKYGLPLDADLVIDMRFLPESALDTGTARPHRRAIRKSRITCCPRRARPSSSTGTSSSST